METLLILHKGFEEIEAVVPIDLLRRASVNVTVASCEDSLCVKGRGELIIQADKGLDAVLDQAYDALILPGGPGIKRLRKDERVRRLVKAQAIAGRWVAAICAAPTLLGDLGILKGRRYSAHFSVAKELKAMVKGVTVVRDGPIITAAGAGSAIAFSLCLIEQLVGAAVSETVARDIEYNPGARERDSEPLDRRA